VEHGLVVAPFDAHITTNEGITVFYPYGGKQPAEQAEHCAEPWAGLSFLRESILGLSDMQAQ
jgi:hypothetical protein